MHFEAKLKLVKENLLHLDVNFFGDIETNIKRIEQEIQNLDEICNERDLNSDELEKKKKAQIDLWAWMKRKEAY